MRTRFLFMPMLAALFACSLSGVAFADELDAPAPVAPVLEEMSAEASLPEDAASGEAGAAEGDAAEVPDKPCAPDVPDADSATQAPEEAVPVEDEPAPVEKPVASAPSEQAPDQAAAPQATIADGWSVQGGKTYYYKGGKKHTGWLVADTAPDGTKGMERYWLRSDGSLASGLIDAGRGWFAYGIAGKGHVVRGSYRDPVTGYFYFADNDGRLLTPGWHITDAYGQGLQRYYIDAKAHAAIPGTSAKGYLHFTRGDTGYVARGYTPTGDGTAFVADNDGRLHPEGWVITDAFGDGMQRYYVGAHGKTTTGLIDAGRGWFAFGVRDKGYVVRGAYRDPVTGSFYFADNDGRLLTPGWHVSDAFGQGLQRYYIDPKAHAAVPGVSDRGWKHFTRGDTGYVARGCVPTGDGTAFLADNEGRLLAPGWHVTDAIGQGLQRYYVDAFGKGVSGHFRVRGAAYYGCPHVGYVLRGKMLVSGNGSTQMALADNDGRLADFEGWYVTDLYDGGLQRYRLDSSVAPGFYGAHVGLFVLDGHEHYGREDQGYLVRGWYIAPDRQLYYGNNDGYVFYYRGIDPLVSTLDSLGTWFNIFGQIDLFGSETGQWLISAIDRILGGGKSVGFVMIDVITGQGISYNADSFFYSASSIKGPYVAAINKYCPGGVTGWAADIMYPTIGISSNEGYVALRDAFGSWPMAQLEYSVGDCAFPAARNYVDMTPRDLAKLWVSIYDYFYVNKNENSDWCSSLFTSPLNSFIHWALGNESTTYTKPGWISSGPGYIARNDAGIVDSPHGRYVLAVMSTAYGWDESLQNLVRAIDAVHTQMVRAL